MQRRFLEEMEMQAIFLASSFHTDDAHLVESTETVIRAFGMELKNGREIDPEQRVQQGLPPALRSRIDESDAVVAFFTKRSSDNWPTHPWVLAEFTHATAKNKQVLVIVENVPELKWEVLPFSDKKAIKYEPNGFHIALVELGRQVGQWRQQSTNPFIRRCLTFLFEQNRSLFQQAFFEKDDAVRAWAADVLLNKRLDKLDAREPPALDRDYITNTEYQLFLMIGISKVSPLANRTSGRETAIHRLSLWHPFLVSGGRGVTRLGGNCRT